MQTREFVRGPLVNLEPDFFLNLSESQVSQRLHQAVVARRVNAALTALALMPLGLLFLLRLVSGQDLAPNLSISGAATDPAMGFCLLALPLVLLLQLTIPLDGGPVVLQNLAPAQRQSGERKTYNCPPAHAYREFVRNRRMLRVVDIECMRLIQEAYESESSTVSSFAQAAPIH